MKHTIARSMIAALVSRGLIGWRWDSVESWSSPSGRIAVLAGASGPITTLECYDTWIPFRAHPWYGPGSGIPDPFAPCTTSDNDGDGVSGNHAGQYVGRTDIGASQATAVYAQLDYLPDNATGVAGGIVYATLKPTTCSSYSPTSPYYTGHRVQVDIVFRDRFNAYLNGLSVIYEHIDESPYVWTTPHSYNWNNPSAYQRLWAIEDFRFNDSTSGGMPIGSVAAIGYAAPRSCATAPHLHQESATGSYNYSKYLGQSVLGRYSDTEYVLLANIMGSAPTDR